MHSINPHFSIIISTTITITTISITTLTITTMSITNIGYFPLRFFFHEVHVTQPYLQSPIGWYLLASSETTFTQTSEAQSTITGLLPAKPLSTLLAKPYQPLSACSQRSQNVRKVRVTMSEQ
jgi:hypothetical protein